EDVFVGLGHGRLLGLQHYHPSARAISETPLATSISDTARISPSREMRRNRKPAAHRPARPAGTIAIAHSHTCGSSRKPVTKNAIVRTEMLVSVARPSVARYCSFVRPRFERYIA